MSLPPGPSELPIVQAMKFGADPYGYLQQCSERFGDSFTLHLPFDPPRVVTSNPALVRQIFALKAEDYEQAQQAFPANIGERSLLFLDGDEHKRDRQLLMPPLHGERLRSYALGIQEITAREAKKLRPGDTLEVHELLQTITLDVVLQCIFGMRLGAESEQVREPLVRWLNGVMQPLTFFAASALKSTRVRAFLDGVASRRRNSSRPALLPWERWADAKNEVIAVLRSKVEHARSHGTEGREDVLALLATARYEDGTSMEIDGIVDELVTLLIGGHETTANTLTWTLAHLLANRPAHQRVLDELHRVFGGGPVDPTRGQELVYTEAAIKEAMRLTPIAPAVGRHLRRPVELGSWSLEPGTIVWPCVALAHRRADSWPNPEQYRPERFLEDSSPSTNTFFPFGGGRRTCIGVAFATFEMRIVLAELLRRLDLTLAEGAKVEGEFRGITIAPKKEFRVKVGAVRNG